MRFWEGRSEVFFPQNTFLGMEQEEGDTGTELCINKMMYQVFH